jgi:glutathione peroxidase
MRSLSRSLALFVGTSLMVGCASDGADDAPQTASAEATDDVQGGGPADTGATSDAGASPDAAPVEADIATPDPDDAALVPADHIPGVVDHIVRDIVGNQVDLREYRGRTLLIVNVASRCGYTPQYAPLQELYETYQDQGFEILAFPCNQFGEQESGTEEEISEFCTENYGITFRLFGKIDVNGNKREPLYTTLCEESLSEFQGDIGWNFTKFLIDTEGRVVGRWASEVDPLTPEIVAAVEAELLAQADATP